MTGVCWHRNDAATCPVCMADKPCPRCINGPMPTWGNVDQVWYCDHHVGEIMREIFARIEARSGETERLDGEATKAGSAPNPNTHHQEG